MVVHELLKYIVYDAKPNKTKLCKFGQNNQILCKNREKLENSCSISILGSNGVNFHTGVLHNLTRYISYAIWIYISQIFGQNSESLCKNRKKFRKKWSCPYLRSADNVGRPYCCCVVFSFLFIFFLLFLSHYLRSAISLPFFIGSLSYLASW